MNLFHRFKTSVEKHHDQPALIIDKMVYTYQQLYDKTMKLAYLFKQNQSRRVGIFASKTLSAYSGVMGAMANGTTYVPLLDEFPLARNRAMMDLGEVDTIILDQSGLDQVEKMAGDLSAEILLVFPEMTLHEIPEALKDKFKIYTSNDLNKKLKKVTEVSPDTFLYICFTSGSTGSPKGVPMAHKNWENSFEVQVKYQHIKGNYRVANGFELTFAISTVEFFIPWTLGASVYPIPEKELSSQINFIKRNKINYWILSPSNAQSLIRFGMLKENSLPHLRHTKFGSEPLSKTFIPTWQKAAPNSQISNGIGSTECNNVAQYHIPKNYEEIAAYHDIVSIGSIYECFDFCFIDNHGKKTEHQGELCVSGPSVFSGYLNKPKLNAKCFFKLPDDDRRWYKTGDIVKQEDGLLFYMDRKDFMVKIRGGRVDLQEINAITKKFAKATTAYSLPYPIKDGIAHYLYLFIDKEGLTDKSAIFKHLKEKLPLYMLPKAIFFMDEFPLTAGRKIDRNQLIEKIKYFEKS